MRVAAVIAEYNPFHNGHAYLFEEIRRQTDAELIVVMMSGDFVQRGAPACMDKYVRTQMALAEGADIVFELPSYGATSSAEIFASSAVSILNQLGCVDYLCFGAETIHPEYFEEIARVLVDEPESYQAELRTLLKTGMNFPAARSLALSHYFNNDECAAILNQPNNILAIEYMKALYRINQSSNNAKQIKAVPILRTGSGYHSIDATQPFSSATAIRHEIETALSNQKNIICLPAQKDDIALTDTAHFHFVDTLSVPESTKNWMHTYFAQRGILTANDFSLPLALRLLEPNLDFMQFIDVSEDIANRIDKNRHQFFTTSQFIDLLTAKNLTATRISRCLFHILLNHQKQLLDAWKKESYGGYIRVLGFKSDAKSFWKAVSPSAKDVLITRTATASSQLNGIGLHMFESDMYASRIYRQTLRYKYQVDLKEIASEPVIVHR